MPAQSRACRRVRRRVRIPGLIYRLRMLRSLAANEDRRRAAAAAIRRTHLAGNDRQEDRATCG